jgi:chemotaxis protein CheX
MAKLDPNFFKPFVDGVIHTIKVNCSIDVIPGTPFIKGQKVQPVFDIAGVIAMNSSGFLGTITIAFPTAVYLVLMSKMLGETYIEITKDVQDGAAELLNQIFGFAKAILNQHGHTIQKAIPTVVSGTNLHTAHLGKTPVIVLPFQSPHGEIHMEIVSENS